MRLRHLVVEGPIGAGKTSLARRLAARLGADLVLEQPDENPFLARFYEDMQRYALPVQLFFLFQRARMLEPLAQPDMFARPVVADFLLDKDPLFARLTLSADELALYEKIYEVLRLRTPAPDLVIYLQAQHFVDLLVERELVRRQREAREQRVLVEQEVGHHRPREHVGLRERLQHARALEQEKELHRQRVALHVLVEAREERVLFGLLEHQIRAEARGQAARQAGLARADRPFHHQMAQLIHGR